MLRNCGVRKNTVQKFKKTEKGMRELVMRSKITLVFFITTGANSWVDHSSAPISEVKHVCGALPPAPPPICLHIVLVNYVGLDPMNVGPCHHGMVCPQVADGGTTSDMEGSCE
jgi:hypothetical protein